MILEGDSGSELESAAHVEAAALTDGEVPSRISLKVRNSPEARGSPDPQPERAQRRCNEPGAYEWRQEVEEEFEAAQSRRSGQGARSETRTHYMSAGVQRL